MLRLLVAGLVVSLSYGAQPINKGTLQQPVIHEGADYPQAATQVLLQAQDSCTKNCSYPNGECVTTEEGSKCVCEEPWEGKDCAQCPKNCSGHGTCLKNATCACVAGYAGKYCSLLAKECPNDCSGHGECDKQSGNCTCKKPWSGKQCNQPDCPNDCGGEEQGECSDKFGKCICKCIGAKCYGGNDCSKVTCKKNLKGKPCNGKGTCVDGACVCTKGWKGEECTEALKGCPDDCNMHGVCDPAAGTCFCEPGFDGIACEIDACPFNCSGHGACKNNTCECSRGWMGKGCEQRKEPPSPPPAPVELPPWKKANEAAPVPECADFQGCDQAKYLFDISVLGFDCDTSIGTVAEQATHVLDHGVDGAADYIKAFAKWQIKDVCPVMCNYCKTPVKASLVLNMDMPTGSKTEAFKEDFVEQVCYFLKRFADQRDCIKVLSMEAGSVKMDVKASPVEGVEPPYVTIRKLEDLLSKQEKPPYWAESLAAAIQSVEVQRKYSQPAMSMAAFGFLVIGIVLFLLLCCCGTAIYCMCCMGGKKDAPVSAAPAAVQEAAPAIVQEAAPATK